MGSFHLEKTAFRVNKTDPVEDFQAVGDSMECLSAENNQLAEAHMVANLCPPAGKGLVHPALLPLESPVHQPVAPRAALGCKAEKDALMAAGNHSPLDWIQQVLPWKWMICAAFVLDPSQQHFGRS